MKVRKIFVYDAIEITEHDGLTVITYKWVIRV